MPRLISEIKCPKLRKLAELRREQGEFSKDNFDDIWAAFEWDITFEKHDFWWKVEDDGITELPKDHPLYDEL